MAAEPSRTSRSAFVVYAVAAAAIYGLWWMATIWIVPDLIASAYRRESIPIINSLVTGQGIHPVGFYTGMWETWKPRLSLLLAAGLIFGAALVPARFAILRAIRRILHGEPTVALPSMLAIPGVLGLTAGVGEAAIRFTWEYGEPSGYEAEALWMTPLAGCLAGATIGAALWLLGRRGFSFRTLVATGITYSFFIILRQLPWGIHPAGAAVFALGAGFEISRHLTDTAAWSRRAQRAALVATTGLVCVGLAVGGAERWQESRMLAAVPATSGDHPNILLLILDTVRAKSLPVYGYARPTMSLLSRRFESGVVFDRAISPSPWTLPSHSTLFTGTWPWEHQTTWKHGLDSSRPTLAEVLTDEGYTSVAFTGNLHFTQKRTGLSRGYQVYRDNPVGLPQLLFTHRGTRAAYRLWQRFTDTAFNPIGEQDGFRQNAELFGWLEAERPDGPLFLTLNYMDAHGVYDAPAPYNTTFRSPAPRAQHPTWLPHVTDQPEALVDEMRDAYDSGLAHLDAIVEQMFERLDGMGLLDNTIVVVLSDHGEQFGEHGLVDHSNSLYSPLLHVPLMIAGPGVPVGARVPTTVSTRDVAATILDLAGIDSHTIPGRSLSPLWSGRGNGSEAETGSYGNVLASVDEVMGGISPLVSGTMRSATDGSVHVILNGNGDIEAYDWATDPDETRNLATDRDDDRWTRAEATLRSSVPVPDSVG